MHILINLDSAKLLSVYPYVNWTYHREYNIFSILLHFLGIKVLQAVQQCRW